MTPLWLMIAALAADGPAPPTAIVIATARGERRVPIVMHQGYAALPAAPLPQWLAITSTVRGGWLADTFAGRSGS